MNQEADRRLAPEAQLEIPALAIGKLGTPLQLVSNHFTIKVNLKGDRAVWRCWRVDFARVSQGSAGSAGRAPKAKGEDEQRVPKAIRKVAVETWMEKLGVKPTDWLHDGNNAVYTRKTVTSVTDQRKELQVGEGRRPFNVVLELKFEQREIDLGWLQKPPDQKADASEAMVAMSEHRRFVQVAIRRLALEREELIAHGRKVICPDQSLGFEEVPLRFGREMWFGYIAQVEVVNGGFRDGRLGPARTTLSLNLVASVGLPEMPLIKLLSKLCVRRPNKSEEEWYEWDLKKNFWKRDYERMRRSLASDLGLRKLKVMAEYAKVKVKGKKVFGITDRPASRQMFQCDEMGGEVSVVDYFYHKHGLRVENPELPCLQLGNSWNCIPIEYITVMGGEHNLEVGKLRQDFQEEVTRRTAMPPSQRRDQILQVHKNKLGPWAALQEKGIDLEMEMVSVPGRLLDAPNLRDSQSGSLQVNYSNRFKALNPPNYQVTWGMWCFAKSTGERDIKWLADKLKETTWHKGMKFTDAQFVEWPEKSYKAYEEGVKQREVPFPKLAEALREDLGRVQRDHQGLKLLVILLDDSEAMTDHLYKLTKLITETELGSFTTQFINCKKGIEAAEKKLNNIMLKITPKVPMAATDLRAAHNVTLAQPHWLLQAKQATMIMGADVCHNVAGISVAGVVGSTDPSCFASYFHEIRGQSPYELNTLKVRSRKSEERIVDLDSMTVSILKRWRSCNKGLPENIIYYRDGVSDGQFVNVLRRELNLLHKAFKEIDVKYEPKLVIVVGQKRHQTRFWRKNADGKGQGSSRDDKGKGKGKGKGKDPAQVPPGTVASDGVAQPSHMNFFLVSQEGIQGTSVPCHYHILHCDKRLLDKGIKVDDFEQITYQLCHMYSRADKSVGYATPAYMADHACERGRDYLEAHFSSSDILSSLGSELSEEKKEASLKQLIQERTTWLNEVAQKGSLLCNGLQSYC